MAKKERVIWDVCSRFVGLERVSIFYFVSTMGPRYEWNWWFLTNRKSTGKHEKYVSVFLFHIYIDCREYHLGWPLDIDTLWWAIKERSSASDNCIRCKRCSGLQILLDYASQTDFLSVVKIQMRFCKKQFCSVAKCNNCLRRNSLLQCFCRKYLL